MISNPSTSLGKTAITGTGRNVYEIVKPLGQSPQFNLYECAFADGHPGIFKITSDVKHNDPLDREAFILRSMATRAAELDAQTTEKNLFNYGAFFPELIDSFVAQDQEGRRANVMRFSGGIQKLEDLTALLGLCEIEQVRVDPRTGAWILGKLLKILSFAHRMGISNPRISSDNILIERELHGLILFDWSQAALHSEGVVPRFIASQELSLAGLVTLEILGGDPDAETLPNDAQLQDNRFQDFIRKLANGTMFDALRAHREFYDLIWTLWPRKFHPFTTHARKGGAR